MVSLGNEMISWAHQRTSSASLAFDQDDDAKLQTYRDLPDGLPFDAAPTFGLYGILTCVEGAGDQ